MSDDMLYSEASEYLEITLGAISNAIFRGRLQKGSKRGTITRVSAEAYKETRDTKKHKAGKANINIAGRGVGSPATVSDEEVIQAVIKYFSEHGMPPTFEELVDEIGLAKSGVSRHIRRLVADGKLEQHLTKVFPIGLRKLLIQTSKEFMNEKLSKA